MELQERWGPEGWPPRVGTRRWGAKISRFFSLSTIFFFPPPPSPPRGPKAARASHTHDSPRAQTCTFEGPGLQNITKIQREEPREREKKNEFCGGRGRKKSEILGGPGRAVQGVMADSGQSYFGQTDFGQFFDRLWPIVGLTDFGQF